MLIEQYQKIKTLNISVLPIMLEKIMNTLIFRSFFKFSKSFMFSVFEGPRQVPLNLSKSGPNCNYMICLSMFGMNITIEFLPQE